MGIGCRAKVWVRSVHLWLRHPWALFLAEALRWLASRSVPHQSAPKCTKRTRESLPVWLQGTSCRPAPHAAKTSVRVIGGCRGRGACSSGNRGPEMAFGNTEERLSQFGNKRQILNAIREHYLMKRNFLGIGFWRSLPDSCSRGRRSTLVRAYTPAKKKPSRAG